MTIKPNVISSHTIKSTYIIHIPHYGAMKSPGTPTGGTFSPLIKTARLLITAFPLCPQRSGCVGKSKFPRRPTASFLRRIKTNVWSVTNLYRLGTHMAAVRWLWSRWLQFPPKNSHIKSDTFILSFRWSLALVDFMKDCTVQQLYLLSVRQCYNLWRSMRMWWQIHLWLKTNTHTCRWDTVLDTEASVSDCLKEFRSWAPHILCDHSVSFNHAYLLITHTCMAWYPTKLHMKGTLSYMCAWYRSRNHFSEHSSILCVIKKRKLVRITPGTSGFSVFHQTAWQRNLSV